ncbi:MAG TPA: 50S ribosomal protein L23, partial [Candidatus Sulfotelmatobacter sp.]|nr:50S ribosomal protein L23 [Candidatus Sulfotelmatobacter sp.]
MNSFEIIKTVRLTEKGTRQGDTLNQYTVVADPRANKTEIRQAVQELFKVKVLRVNTLNVTGKFRRQRTKQAGQAP